MYLFVCTLPIDARARRRALGPSPARGRCRNNGRRTKLIPIIRSILIM